ncbi:MAG: hypothetical protein IJ438_06085 [Clostridia bacterium]|nr:hypothetical protein [Clostridia bacterium]
MKKRFALLCMTALFLIPTFALAEGAITLDEAAVFGDMPCSWQQGYEPVITGNTLNVHVPLQVSGVSGKVTAALYVDDEAASPLKTQGVSAAAYRGDSGTYNTIIKATLVRGRVNGDYPCTLIFTGQGSDGTAIRGEYRFVLHIRDGRMPEESLRPVISDVKADLRVGEDSALTFLLTNHSRHADLTSLTLRVTDASGDILPAGTDVLLLPDMAAGDVQTISIPLKVKTNAAVSLHTLKFDLSWTALDTPGTWTESFTLPVQQTLRLEQGGVQLATTLLQGEMATLTVPLMNLGRADLSNVMATLTLPGITERQSVLVGTLAPGETKQAKLTFIPGQSALGHYEGTLTITGEDAYGNTAAMTLPVETTVEEPVTITLNADGTQEEKAQTPPWLTIALGAGCGLLLLVCIIDGAVLRRKVRKLEEDRL